MQISLGSIPSSTGSHSLKGCGVRQVWKHRILFLILFSYRLKMSHGSQLNGYTVYIRLLLHCLGWGPKVRKVGNQEGNTQVGESQGPWKCLRMSWNPPKKGQGPCPASASTLGDFAGLQQELAPFTMELNTLLVLVSGELREETREELGRGRSGCCATPKKVNYQRMMTGALSRPSEHKHTKSNCCFTSTFQISCTGPPAAPLTQNCARKTLGKHSFSLVQSIQNKSTTASTSHSGSQGIGPRVRL